MGNGPPLHELYRAWRRRERIATAGADVADVADMAGCWTAADRERVLVEIADGLWRYVGGHARDIPAATALAADLTGLSAASLGTLAHLHLVLGDEVERFVTVALPILLAEIRPVAPPRPEARRGAVRGAIAWGATTAARAAAGGADRALFVSSAAHKGFVTPETRLLIATLQALRASCLLLCPPRSNDSKDGEGVAGAPPGAAARWDARVARVAGEVEQALRDRRLHAAGPDTTAAMTVQAGDLAACRRSPRHAVRLLAQAYARYHGLIQRPLPAALLDALRQRVLIPLDDDALYELWALLGAATVLDDLGYALQTAGLVGRHPAPFTYRAPGGRGLVRLRFGHTPAHWRRDSRYRAVFERYGLAGATRQPDLIVEARQGQGRPPRHLLVEVKRTRDPGYIADSIYKVLGYLADFAAVFAGQEESQALLLLWDGVANRAVERPPVAAARLPDGPSQSPAQTLVLATHHDYRDRLRAWLEAIAPIAPIAPDRS